MKKQTESIEKNYRPLLQTLSKGLSGATAVVTPLIFFSVL
jgi:hypothetical protein